MEAAFDGGILSSDSGAFWRNIPAAIWGYKLGGYQVLKKWLSYREHDVLGRALLPEEVLYFAEMARRVGGILVTAWSNPS